MFLLLVAVPAIPVIRPIASIPLTMRSWNDLGEAGLLHLGLLAICMFCFVGWFWSMGLFLGSTVKNGAEIEDRIF